MSKQGAKWAKSFFTLHTNYNNGRRTSVRSQVVAAQPGFWLTDPASLAASSMDETPTGLISPCASAGQGLVIRSLRSTYYVHLVLNIKHQTWTWQDAIHWCPILIADYDVLCLPQLLPRTIRLYRDCEFCADQHLKLPFKCLYLAPNLQGPLSRSFTRTSICTRTRLNLRVASKAVLYVGT